MRTILASGLLPEGSLQFVAGDITPIFGVLDEQDSLAFTGSAATAQSLRTISAVLERGCAFPPRPTHSTPPSLRHRPGPTRRSSSVLRRRRRRNGRQGRPEMHRHPQSDRARHPPRHRQRRPRRQTGGDHGRPSRRRRHRHGGPRRSGAASRCPRRRRRLGPHGVRTGTLRTRHRTRRVMAPTLLRADDPASSPAHVVEPFGPVSTLLGYQDLDGAVALVAKGRGSLVASVSGPTPTRPRGSPSGSPVPRSGPHHRRNIRGCVDRPWFTASATCSRRARSSGWR